MRSNEELNDILAELAREHRSVEAPTSLGEHLVELASMAPPSSLLPSVRRWVLGLAALAVAVYIGVVVSHPFLRHVPRPTQMAHSDNSTPTSAPARLFPPARSNAVGVNHARVSSARKRSPGNSSINLSEAFLALPSSEGLPAPSAASLVRLRIERDCLRQYGLDVPPTLAPETILAEFLVGEDGLPRAVRIVR